MKAASYTHFGEPAEVLAVTDVARPEPRPGEVLIRTILSPIHNHDLWTIRGSYGYKPELPALGGSEAVGIVEAVGEGVDAAMIGKRVVNAGRIGTWAEYFTASAAGVLPLPDAISDEAGAQLIAMPFSAISLLEFLDVKEGDTVIQTAANGAVGKIFADLARARGIRTVNLVRRAEAVAELEALGMENVLSTDQDGWRKRAREIVGKDGAQAAIDSVGGPIVADIADMLGLNGLLVVFGTATGQPLELRAGSMITNHLIVKGFWGSRVSSEMPADQKVRLITELVTLAAQGKMKLPSGGEFSLDNVADAVRASLTPGKPGKILIRP